MTLASGPRWPSLLSRPVWMRGAEMGINARGVVIGNEVSLVAGRAGAGQDSGVIAEIGRIVTRFEG